MNKKQPLFSIVIPVHNEQDYLIDCIKSIKDQQVDFFYEIIVIDNGSTDNTAEIVKSKGITLINEPIMGVGRARRTGTRLASGRYILHIDADTRLPKYYLKQV